MTHWKGKLIRLRCFFNGQKIVQDYVAGPPRLPASSRDKLGKIKLKHVLSIKPLTIAGCIVKVWDPE